MLAFSFLFLFIVQCQLNQALASSEIESLLNSFESNYILNNANEFGLIPPIDPNISEDARLTTPQLITKYGYNAETHYVTTEDGYILQLHRISGGPKSPPKKGKKVVFLAHGILVTSSCFVLTGVHHALGYMLADNGYDVWLGNNRGNTYSTNHTKYDPYGLFSRGKFWAFSWHEVGKYDFPASIDYILDKTGESKLQIIAWSQGSTTSFVLLSEKPEYNDKIEMIHALGPAVFMSHIKSPVARILAANLPFLHMLKKLIGYHYISLPNWVVKQAAKVFSRDDMLTQAICENYWFILMGVNSDQLNTTILPILMAHTAAGSSTNQLVNYGQSIRSGSFRLFDYGWLKNKRVYKQKSPPDYNLKNVRAPVALYYAKGDWMVDVEDVNTLKKHLPNVVKGYLIPHKQFNYIDFVWGTDAPILLYDEILKNMKYSVSYTNHSISKIIDYDKILN